MNLKVIITSFPYIDDIQDMRFIIWDTHYSSPLVLQFNLRPNIVPRYWEVQLFTFVCLHWRVYVCVFNSVCLRLYVHIIIKLLIWRTLHHLEKYNDVAFEELIAIV